MIHRMIPRLTILLLALVLLVLAHAAHAADPVFPPGSRVGLVPPAGMTTSKTFEGFEDRDHNAAIVIVELSGGAYAEIEKGFTVEALTAKGIAADHREDVMIKDGRGFLITARQQINGLDLRKWAMIATSGDVTALISVQAPVAASDVYPDEKLRAALATFTIRPSVPVEEELALLPYSLRDLAGFRIVRATPSGAVLLTDGPKDAIEYVEQPVLLITIEPGAPGEPSDRESFARRVLAGTPGVKELHITRSEPLRINGQAGHEIVVEAKDAKTNADVTLVQWLRFGAEGYLHIIGAARKDTWDKVFPRFRAVRDGIEQR